MRIDHQHPSLNRHPFCYLALRLGRSRSASDVENLFRRAHRGTDALATAAPRAVLVFIRFARCTTLSFGPVRCRHFATETWIARGAPRPGHPRR